MTTLSQTSELAARPKVRATFAPRESQDPRTSGRAAKRKTLVDRLLTHVGLLLVCAGFLLPFAWMVSTSFKTVSDAMKPNLQLIPRPFVPETYTDVLTNPKVDFPNFARNTLIVAILGVLGTVVSSSLVAYGFAKIRFKGRGFLFAVMLATMMVPFPVTMVSLFSIFHWIGANTPVQMLGTFRPLWVPAWFGSAFNIFLLRQFFMTLPDELSEAARIDGCSEIGIFLRIVLPLARPAITVVALFHFMYCWNDFMGPLVYLMRPEQYTLALGLQSFQSQHGGIEWPQLMAASVLVVAPVILLFFMTQKTFIQGIATTGLKG